MNQPNPLRNFWLVVYLRSNDQNAGMIIISLDSVMMFICIFKVDYTGIEVALLYVKDRKLPKR